MAAPSSIAREIRQTLALAVPIIIGQVSQMLMGVLDSLMIGRVGTVPLAASAFAGTIFGVFFVLGIGLLYSVAVLVARARGAEQPRECGELLRHGLVVAVVFGAMETAAMLVIGGYLDRMGQPPEVVANAKAFYAVIAASLIPVMIFQVLRQYSESLGRPWVPMGIMLGGVALNAGLNWVLIYGHWGFHSYGLLGAGVSTLLARIGVMVTIFVVLAGDDSIRSNWPVKWRANLSRSRFKELLKLGMPASIQLLFESGAFAAAAIMMGWLGVVSLAAHQIALSCAALTFMFLLGLAMAVSMRISQAMGAREFSRLRSIGFTGFGLGTAMMMGFALLFLFLGHGIASQFVDDAAVVSLASKLLVVAALFQVFDGGQVVGSGMLRGMADVRIPTIITFVGYWLIALPAAYALGFWFELGAVGVWIALAIGLAFAAVFFGWRFILLTKSECHPQLLRRLEQERSPGG